MVDFALIGGFGATPYGSSPYGTGPPITLQIINALAIRENVVRLTFSEPVKFTNTLGPNDGSQVFLYTIAVVEGTSGLDGEPTRPVSPVIVQRVSNGGDPLATLQVDVITDRPFTPFPSRYVITVVGLVTTAGDPLSPFGSFFEFFGVFKRFQRPVPDQLVSNRDFANPQTQSALLSPPLPNATDPTVLGVFPIDSSGDYAADQGLESYRKRVLRRLTTRRGRFRHLPTYGVGIPSNVKQLARRGVIDAIAAEAEEQIRLEPETLEVSVTVDTESTGIAFFRVRARTNIGSIVTLKVPILPER